MVSKNVLELRGEINPDLRRGAVVKMKTTVVVTLVVLLGLVVRSIRALVTVRLMVPLFGYPIVLADRDLPVSHLRVLVSQMLHLFHQMKCLLPILLLRIIILRLSFLTVILEISVNTSVILVISEIQLAE